MAESEAAGDWFSDDEFWTRYAPLMFGGDRWSEVPSVVDGILALSGLDSASGLAVLDSCCGPGRHGLEFARRGAAVTGVDITQPYLDAFAASAASESLSVDLVHADVRSFERPSSYDLALNLFTSFGYFATRQEDEAYLATLRLCLKPGGTLVLELTGKETVVRDFIEGEWFERDGMLVLTEFEVVGAWEALRNRWIIVDGTRRIDRSWDQRLYSARELEDSLRRAGFSDIRAFGDFDGRPYDRSSRCLVVVARA